MSTPVLSPARSPARGRPGLHGGLRTWLRRLAGSLAVPLARWSGSDAAGLRQLEERLARTEALSLVMVAHAGLDGRWLKVPQRLCDLLGYSEAELLSRSFQDVTHPEDVGDDCSQCERLIRGEIQSFDMEKRYIRRDGSILWVYLNCSIVRDDDERPVHFLGYIKDISDRKRAEAALQESESRFRDIANSAPVFIFQRGPDGRLTFANRSLLDFLGLTFEELAARDMNPVHPDDRAAAARRPQGPGEYRQGIRLLGADGEYHWVYMRIVPRIAADGELLGYIGAAVDMTEHRRAEQEARQHRDEIAHVSRVATLGELAASLAHELNQPLAAILSNAQAAQRLLARSPNPAGQRAELAEIAAIFDDIVKDDERAGQILARIRGLVRKAPSAPGRVDLNEIVRDVAALVGSEALIRNAALDLGLDPGLPAVEADRVQLHQAVLNLVANGLEALGESPPGSAGKRRLTVRTSGAEDGWVQVAVRDTGAGIPPDRLPQIFEPFYTTKPRGLGLGLSITRSIVEAYGGLIWAENVPEGGATVHISLPAGPGVPS